MCDSVLVIETRHLFAGKVCSVVGNNGVREPKETYYILPQELDNLLLGDSKNGAASTHLVK